MLLELALVGLVAAGAAAIRLAPRMRLPRAYGSDTFFHLFYAREIRRNRMRLPPQMDRILLPHENTYPHGYHTLLALLTERARLWAERATGAACDAVVTMLAGVVVLLWWPAERAGAIWVALMIAVSPGLLRIGNGPRAYNGSARPFGQMLYAIHALAAHFAVQGSATALLCSVAAGAALVLSSKFSTQAMLFFSAVLAVAAGWQYIALALGAVVLAVLLPGGRGARILWGHYAHTAFYFRHLQKVFVQPHARRWVDYRRAAAAALRGLFASRGWRGALVWLLGERYAPHVLVFIFTPLVVVLACAPLRGPLDGVEWFLTAWCFAAFACFLATSARPLMFLGDGERYLEYAVVPAAILFWRWIGEAGAGWVTAYLVYCAAAAVAFHKLFLIGYAGLQRQFDDGEAAFARLNARPRATLMPIGSFHWQALYRTSHPVLTIAPNVDPALLPVERFKALYEFPYPARDFSAIVAEHKVAYILTDDVHLRHYQEKILGAPHPLLAAADRLSDSALLILELKTGGDAAV